jgi:hypothetical protein
VQVKRACGQDRGGPRPIRDEEHEREHHQRGEQTVARHPVRRDVRLLTPHDADPVDVEDDAREHDEPPVLGRGRPQVGDDPALTDVRQEM